MNSTIDWKRTNQKLETRLDTNYWKLSGHKLETDWTQTTRSSLDVNWKRTRASCLVCRPLETGNGSFRCTCQLVQQTVKLNSIVLEERTRLENFSPRNNEPTILLWHWGWATMEKEKKGKNRKQKRTERSWDQYWKKSVGKKWLKLGQRDRLEMHRQQTDSVKRFSLKIWFSKGFRRCKIVTCFGC